MCSLVINPRSMATLHFPNQSLLVILGLFVLAKRISGISIGLVISLHPFCLAEPNDVVATKCPQCKTQDVKIGLSHKVNSYICQGRPSCQHNFRQEGLKITAEEGDESRMNQEEVTPSG
jgi:hypothetical protein